MRELKKTTRQPINISLNSRVFPPEEFFFNFPDREREKKFILLGESNKEDLIPISIDTEELLKAVSFGHVKQFIYSGVEGDLYDVCIYCDENGYINLYDIRHRQIEKEKREKIKDAASS